MRQGATPRLPARRVLLPWFVLLLAAGCSSSDGSTPGGGHTCANACQNMVTCGTQTQAKYDACVQDCGSEPWPQNYIECRATTCGKTEKECENWQ
jgi:hypothetical protein